MLHIDVAKVDRDVAHVAYVAIVSENVATFVKNVSSVLDVRL